MILIPAIDLMDGKAVRLAEGDRERVTVYSDDPLELVDRFADAGATRLHVVDLDGAFAGQPKQSQLVGALTKRAHERGMVIEVGGGLREPMHVELLVEYGVDMVVIGTLAVRQPDASAALCAKHPGKIIVAIDARNGRVAVDGWREQSGTTTAALAQRAQGWGAAGLLFTDVNRDGLQVGAAVEATASLQSQVSIPVIASGGVGSLEDLDALANANIAAVVFGRAIYENSFDLKQAIARCSNDA